MVSGTSQALVKSRSSSTRCTEPRDVGQPQVGSNLLLELSRQLPEPVLSGEGHVRVPGQVPEQGEGLDRVADVARREDRIRGPVLEDAEGHGASRDNHGRRLEPAFDQAPGAESALIELDGGTAPQLREKAGSLLTPPEGQETAGEVDEHRVGQLGVGCGDGRGAFPGRIRPRGESRVDGLHRDVRGEHLVVEVLDVVPQPIELAASVHQDGVAQG